MLARKLKSFKIMGIISRAWVYVVTELTSFTWFRLISFTNFNAQFLY